MILGIVGLNGAGKDTVAELLIKKGFKHYSLSDIIREKLTEQGKEINMDNLREMGGKLRKENGTGILAQLTIKKIKKGDYVLTSIRNPGEVEALRKLPDFILVHLDSSPEVRFERLKKRAKKGDEEFSSFENFQKREEQNADTDPNKLQTIFLLPLADCKLLNNGNLEELKQNLDKLLTQLNQ